MTGPSPLLHVGYIKTGSTWLQRRLFSKPEIGIFQPGQQSRSALISNFVVCNDYDFDAESVRRSLSEIWHAHGSGNCLPVWSDETLLGNPLQRLYNGRPVADKLHDVFPQARVLICIRRQEDIAVSMYRQHIHEGGRHTFEMFIGTGHELESFTPILRPDFLEYHHSISYYQGLFGQDRVLVLPLELLRQNAEDFIGRIARFAELSRIDVDGKTAENVGMGSVALNILRRLNMFVLINPLSPLRENRRYQLVNKVVRKFDKIVPSTINRRLDARMKSAVSKVYADRFRTSNRRTIELTGLDLAAFGYQV